MNLFIKKNCEKMADELADKVSLSPKVYNAFKEVDRSVFVPMTAHAFTLNPQPIVGNQWISSPLTVAKITMALELDEADSVLEVGCGSGYQAAILSKIVRVVFTIERIKRLCNEAKENIKKLNITNVNIRCDDGNNGWKKYAPYDRILLSAATTSIDERLFSQLKDGGILIAPIKFQNRQFITKFKKNREIITKEQLWECDFVPLLSGIE
ncbi:protein-L-isoaspartate(D-aspartate) O-methyltransferase [uncultured Campylobacter sp.]|uniref:protein-L-isoaspartate(D-aspartate) O-methyltransferase n=1 Tax=uncultured Campylobacter sp. TaxID=218934 RepID=UPI00261465C7|nr:protein-L-isoaspartate(D-aspartate) O-methyltransferase [uncultured Campylobacter sp.]